MATQDVLGSIVQLARLDQLLNLCRANSLWPMTFGLACCAIEMMATGAARFDLARFGAEVFRPSPRQCDVMIVSGTVNRKIAPAVQVLYDQMPEPKWVIAMGNCAISGGPFVFEGQYGIVEGVSKLFPVDVVIPGCPPRPEALIEGILTLEEKLTGTRRWPRVTPEPLPGPAALAARAAQQSAASAPDAAAPVASGPVASGKDASAVPAPDAADAPATSGAPS